MAAEGVVAAALRLVTLITFLVVLSHPGQATQPLQNAALNPPTIEELSTALVVNQLAILQTMQDLINTSYDSPGKWTEIEAMQRRVAREEVERLKETLKAEHKQAAEAMRDTLMTAFSEELEELVEDFSTNIASVTQELRTWVEELLEEKLQEELSQTKEERLALLATQVHNDTLPSFCSGNKELRGSIGSLEVTDSGSYSNGVDCSWNISLPFEAPLKLTWSYIHMEEHDSCSYDWVEVKDIFNGGTSLYGKLCSHLPASRILSPTKNIAVAFHSDGSNVGRGFRLHYSVQLH